MTFYIEMADLTANAMIEAGDDDFLSDSTIQKYGNKVAQVLAARDVDTHVALLLSRDHTDEFLESYSEFFEREERNGQMGFKLKDGKTKSDLINKFRGYLSLEILKAFISSAATSALH